MNRKILLVSTLSATFFGVSRGATLFGPTPYFSSQDSPWSSFLVDNTGTPFYLEDFEDGELNTPNVRQMVGVDYVGTTSSQFSPNAIAASVDGDDGIIDGDGSMGVSWIAVTNSGSTSFFMDFEFLPDSEGRYPTHVGFVVTSVINPDTDVDATWRNVDGERLFDDGEFDPKDWDIPGGAPRGDPRLMRFIGLSSEQGIQRLSLANVAQLDHLQYGFSIPEPSVSFLLVLATGAGIMRRRHCNAMSGRDVRPSDLS